jgi:hypothetical protein
LSRAGSVLSHPSIASLAVESRESVCVYDSSAYFIRDVSTGKEVLIFGDVEPDSISLSPRNSLIWQEAAPKIAAGALGAVFIECSYDNSQSDDRLFGHLKPYYIMEELRVLAAEVEAARQASTRKRKRSGAEDNGVDAAAPGRRKTTPMPLGPLGDDPVSPKTVKPPRVTEDGTGTPHLSTPTAELSLGDVDHLPDLHAPAPLPTPARALGGLKVVIIHMKDKLDDGLHVGDIILEQLLEYEEEAQLGCEFVISSVGQSIYL